MKPAQRKTGTIFSITGLFLVGLIWLVFAPAQFGGQAAYAIINGNSMEPLFERGDLVVLYRAGEYRIGDIATYRHPEIGPVFHRIIGTDGHRFVFKGDNNDWTDTYRPDSTELIGKLWLHIPRLGKTLSKLRSPWILGGLAATIVFLFLSTPGSAQRLNPKSTKERPMENQSVSKMDILFFLAAMAIASLLLAIYAFNQALTISQLEDITYKQVGAFSYSADAPAGVYSANRVQAGEPVFRQLIDKVSINFSYQLISDLPPNVSGTHRLDLIINHSSGWNWVIELQPETGFAGATFNAAGIIDLTQVQGVINNLEQQTGLQNQQYGLVVAPAVTINGTLAGHELREEFTPRLAFQLNPLQMQVAPAPKGQADPFVVSQSGAVQQEINAPNTFSVMGYRLNISTLRLLAMIGLTLFGGSALGMGAIVLNERRQNPTSEIETKYGNLLITVHNTDFAVNSPIIEVTSMDDLAKIAGRNERMILRQVRGSIHHYFVQDNGAAYHYQLVKETGKLKRPASLIKVRPL